ncbi:hypothetical protein CI109_103578 [Kwoniella shandongensis]|uniref:Glycosyltransferase family 28 N-terminal domain-containing protein n=1 Tax=Kwoniella shandongensis TaxID=1734106 RepID=A0AAJ8MX02_9TREE
MPAVSKKLSDIFSCSPSGSPRNSPRNSPLLSPTKLNDTVPPLQSTPVSRSGMPCSSQLFDLFKFVASGRNNGDLDPEVDSDEDDDEVSLHISPEQQEEANVPQAMPAEPAVDNDVKLEKWIDETIRKTELQPLSLSNLSPWRFPGSEKALKRPRLPGKKAQPSPELDESPVDTPLEAPTGRPFRAAVGVDDIPDEDKLAAIVDEFGEIAGLLEGDEPERILAESKGSLFKLAMDSAAAAFAHQPDVIHAGPVTVHRPGSLKPARRVWMELSAEMVTTYPSADEAGRVRPLRSVLRLDIQLDDEPKETNVIETSSQATLVETPVSSPGVERKGSFRAFSRGRSAQGNSTEARSPSPLIREAGLHPSMLRTEMSHKNFASASDSSFDFNIAVLKDQAWFAQAFESAVDASHQRKYKHDAKRPRMVLQVAGHDCLATDEDLESDRSGSYDSEEGDDEEDGHNGLLRETRKAEKAALSAKVFGLKEEEGVWIGADIKVMARINDLRGTRTPAPSVPAEQKPSPPLFDEPIARTASPASNTVVDHPADILAPPRDLLLQAPVVPADAVKYIPYIANKPLHAMARIAPRTFTCLTIGSRGDIQPYIALCLRLKQDGHKVVIVTHAGGDPTALMKLSTEHKTVLLDSWNACQDSDVLIESPSTMAGVHIAEALKIPYFRAFTMPWTRTSAYPHAFMVPAFEMGPSFNYSTYVLFDNIMWRATSGQINKWRKHYLGLKFTDMTALSLTKIPFLYNFSAAVVPKPLDWHDDIVITGYWNLEDSDTEWSPPPELEAFMAKAKEDQRPLVYIVSVTIMSSADKQGFGSIVVPRPNAMTKSIIKAVEKGWSSRGGDPAKEGEEIVFPPSCYGVDKIPHSWLFPRVAMLTVSDQFFWSIRVTKLEVGLKVPSLRSDDIAAALVKATTDRVMMEKAARIGERIRSENGVNAAVQAIHNNLSRAGADRTKMRWAK